MKQPWRLVAGWYHAVLLAALPWLAWWQPRWAPLVVGGVALVHLHVRRSRAAEPWSSVTVVASQAIFLMAVGGWRGPVWAWLALAGVVAAAVRFIPRDDGGRPDAGDCVAVIGWAAPFAVDPTLLTVERGGWLAPALLLLAARELGAVLRTTKGQPATRIGPPTRDVRGTLSLRGVVATEAGLPATVPLALDLRAGESLAVLCHEPAVAQSLADLLAGRSRPFRGEILVDGAPLGAGDRLVAVVAPGEPFVPGDLDDNLRALLDEPLHRSARAAAHDACDLAGVVEALGGRSLTADGAPLDSAQRLRVLAARALVSHYRVLVVVDPGIWVDARSADRWRAAIVRTSVGRTAIWITVDPELADRADHHCELVEGNLRSC